MMKAELVSVGTELLLGEIVDTNSAYLARSLQELGIDLYWMSTVGDNMGRLLDVLRRAWSRSDLIVCTGGIGPTDDDMTREGIAALFGEEMTVQPEIADDCAPFSVDGAMRCRRATSNRPRSSRRPGLWLTPSALLLGGGRSATGG